MPRVWRLQPGRSAVACCPLSPAQRPRASPSKRFPCRSVLRWHRGALPGLQPHHVRGAHLLLHAAAAVHRGAEKQGPPRVAGRTAKPPNLGQRKLNLLSHPGLFIAMRLDAAETNSEHHIHRPSNVLSCRSSSGWHCAPRIGHSSSPSRSGPRTTRPGWRRRGPPRRRSAWVDVTATGDGCDAVQPAVRGNEAAVDAGRWR